MDIFYAHRDRPLKLSALSVVCMASNRFEKHEINDDLVTNMSKEGLKVFRPILNNNEVTDWMRTLGINWKKPHHWIIMARGFKFETQQVDQYRRIPDSVFRSQGIVSVCCSVCP